MYIKIKKAELVPDKFGQHIKISMIGLYQDDGKWMKWIKLNEATIEVLLEGKINVLEEKKNG